MYRVPVVALHVEVLRSAVAQVELVRHFTQPGANKIPVRSPPRHVSSAAFRVFGNGSHPSGQVLGHIPYHWGAVIISTTVRMRLAIIRDARRTHGGIARHSPYHRCPPARIVQGEAEKPGRKTGTCLERKRHLSQQALQPEGETGCGGDVKRLEGEHRQAVRFHCIFTQVRCDDIAYLKIAQRGAVLRKGGQIGIFYIRHQIHRYVSACGRLLHVEGEDPRCRVYRTDVHRFVFQKQAAVRRAVKLQHAQPVDFGFIRSQVHGGSGAGEPLALCTLHGEGLYGQLLAEGTPGGCSVRPVGMTGEVIVGAAGVQRKERRTDGEVVS